MMNRFLIIAAGIQLFILQGYSQTLPYVNHTEMGPMVGVMDDGIKRMNFSIQVFNGVKPHPNHEIGFLIGLDSYSGFGLMPLALGWRGIFNHERKYSPYVSMDLGYGSSMLNKRSRENQWESWYHGGMLVNSAVGIRKKSKNGRYSYSLSLGFKKQKAAFFEGLRSLEFTQEGGNTLLPPGFTSVREENYILNSLFLKGGIIF